MQGLIRGVQLIWQLLRLLIAELQKTIASATHGSFSVSDDLLALVAIAEIWLKECADSRGNFNLNVIKLLTSDPFKGSRKAFEDYREAKGIK